MAEPMPSDEQLRELYPQVDEFAAAMRAELWANRAHGDRPSWLSMTSKQAYFEVAWHAGKLVEPLRAHDHTALLEHAADVGNAALFIWDQANEMRLAAETICGARYPRSDVDWACTLPHGHDGYGGVAGRHAAAVDGEVYDFTLKEPQ